ncbi:PR-1-like protein [Linnemannia elongata AG-77]|uniref:PR-1-like protein n=1 Tax=Linnemannia elongata AG-77 TaxID=1314771 RepID=A0A197K0U4_9FUNG|nr:PR-1-like protein [Linnemannia elongata AG-77]
MKIPRSVLAAVAALLVTSASSAQQDTLDMDGDMNAAIEPVSADPVGFLNMGRGRLVSITSSEYESIERGEWPDSSSKPGEEINPDAAATAVGTVVVLSQDEIKSVLEAHNKLRALHGAPALTWNVDSAKFGDSWLQPCEFKHSGGKYGENLAAGYKDFPTAVQAWYDEIKSYNFATPGFTGGTGHFTQVVWKSSKTLGCAKRICPKWTMYICEYDPPGNIVTKDNSYFKNNVLPLGTKL